MHYHIQIAIEEHELVLMKDFLQKFKSINLKIEPEDDDVKDIIRQLFLRVFGVIKHTKKVS